MTTATMTPEERHAAELVLDFLGPDFVEWGYLSFANPSPGGTVLSSRGQPFRCFSCFIGEAGGGERSVDDGSGYPYIEFVLGAPDTETVAALGTVYREFEQAVFRAAFKPMVEAYLLRARGAA